MGVTFQNDDGESRQDILSRMTGDEEIEIEKPHTTESLPHM